MGPFEIIVIIAAALIVAGVIGVSIWNKAHGKSTTCSECGSGCAGCSHCAYRPKNETKK